MALHLLIAWEPRGLCSPLLSKSIITLRKCYQIIALGFAHINKSSILNGYRIPSRIK